MTHFFDIDIATEYGLNEAIILSNFHYWIAHNAANGKNFYDGRYWTYNSNAAFCKLFPYLSEKKIRNALKHLEEEGIILTGNYNKSSYDRTLWYAFTDKGASIFFKKDEEEKSIPPKGQMDDVQKGEPIPLDTHIVNNSIYPHNPPTGDVKKPKKKSRAEKKQDVEEVIHAYTQDEEVLDRIDAWLEVRKEKRSPNTVRAVKINLKKLDNMAHLSKMSVPQYLDEIVARGWAAFYVINNFSKNNTNYRNNTNCNNSQKFDDSPVTEYEVYGD